MGRWSASSAPDDRSPDVHRPLTYDWPHDAGGATRARGGLDGTGGSQGTRGVDHVSRRAGGLRARRRSVPALAQRSPGGPGHGRRSAIRPSRWRTARGPTSRGGWDGSTWPPRRPSKPWRAPDEARDEREREHVQAVAAMQRGDTIGAYDRLRTDGRPVPDGPYRGAHRRPELHHPGRLSRWHRPWRAGASRRIPASLSTRPCSASSWSSRATTTRAWR